MSRRYAMHNSQAHFIFCGWFHPSLTFFCLSLVVFISGAMMVYSTVIGYKCLFVWMWRAGFMLAANWIPTWQGLNRIKTEKPIGKFHSGLMGHSARVRLNSEKGSLSRNLKCTQTRVQLPMCGAILSMSLWLLKLNWILVPISLHGFHFNRTAPLRQYVTPNSVLATIATHFSSPETHKKNCASGVWWRFHSSNDFFSSSNHVTHRLNSHNSFF